MVLYHMNGCAAKRAYKREMSPFGPQREWRRGCWASNEATTEEQVCPSEFCVGSSFVSLIVYYMGKGDAQLDKRSPRWVPVDWSVNRRGTPCGQR